MPARRAEIMANGTGVWMPWQCTRSQLCCLITAAIPGCKVIISPAWPGRDTQDRDTLNDFLPWQAPGPVGCEHGDVEALSAEARFHRPRDQLHDLRSRLRSPGSHWPSPQGRSAGRRRGQSTKRREDSGGTRP